MNSRAAAAVGIAALFSMTLFLGGVHALIPFTFGAAATYCFEALVRR